MKPLKIWLSIVIIGLFWGCDINQPELNQPDTNVNFGIESKGINANTYNMVEIPFKAAFFTQNPGIGFLPDPRCEEPRLLETQVGEGEATYLGRFDAHFTFCIDISELLPSDDTPGVLTEGESAPYNNSEVTFTAANGDKLYIDISGAVLPSSDPNFDLMFMDPFEFIGGTGRFEGAWGGGVTNSFVKSGLVSHDWIGTLVLPRPGKAVSK